MPFLGELSALLTACLWSGSAMVFASATKLVGSFQVNITRLILAAVYLVLLIVVFQFDVRLSSTQILNLGLSGVVGLTLGDTFLFKAFQEIGARISMLVMSVAPAVAAILAYFVLGETLSVVGILGIITTVFGVSVVVLDRGAVTSQKIALTTTGLIYAALAAAGQGSGLVLAKMAFQEGNVNGFVASSVRIIASLAVLLPIALMTNRYNSPVRMFRDDRRAFWLTALGSVFGPFLGISFSLIAIEYTKVGIAATIMATVPILMLPLLRFIYKERLTWRAVVGAFVAVGGVAILFLR